MNILFISELLPTDTYASQVIFYRHLSKLVDEGHQIHVICDQNSYNRRIKDLPIAFKLYIIPNRRLYYLPYHPKGILQWLRFFLLYHEYVKPIIKRNAIESLFSVVYGNFLSPFTAYVQERTKIPLFSFFHDDTIEISLGINVNIIRANTAKILNASRIVFVASTSFILNWPLFSHKFRLLYPIPSTNKRTYKHKIRSSKISIGYAGTFYEETLPCFIKFCEYLQELNTNFTIIGNNKNIDYIEKTFNQVKSLPLFSTADESNIYLCKNCDLGIIIYPEEISQMPWIQTCFPSKFIQFCSIGLPTLIIAPNDSAIGKWCIDNHWPLYLDRVSIDGIKNLFTNVLYTEELNEKISYVRNQTFNAEKIHAQLVNEII